MPRQTDPSHRRSSSSLDGAAGRVVFARFPGVELAVARIADFVVPVLVRTERVDVGHGDGIALSWIDRPCRHLTGHGAGELVLEALSPW